MKKFTMTLFLLIALLSLTNVQAAESIVGTWQGKLVTGPGAEVGIQFVIKQEANDSYSAVVNSLDSEAIKNIQATSTVYASGVLKLEVAELNGSYEGTLKDGKIDGKWKQEGQSFPLSLSPYQKPTLSKKDMNKLLGSWNGKLTIPGGSLTVVFRFEMSEKGDFAGFLDSPDQGGFGIPVTDMEMSDGSISLKIPSIKGEYKGKLAANEIVGEFKQLGTPLSLTLKKGEYKAQTYKLSLPKEIIDQLIGEWNGPLTMQGMSITVVFRFEMTRNSEFVGFQDSPDQGAKRIPITEANLSDGKLTLKIAAVNGEFKGQLSGDNLVGEWSQMGMKTPLSLKKGKYVAQVYKLALPKETIDQLSGKWNGKLGPLTLAFRFEKTQKGDFLGFLDSPDQGAKGIPITEANLADGKLTLKIASVGGEFKGKIQNDKLAGDWTQAGMNNPLSLAKEKP
jgi:hypothetical protein